MNFGKQAPGSFIKQAKSLAGANIRPKGFEAGQDSFSAPYGKVQPNKAKPVQQMRDGQKKINPFGKMK